MMQTFTLMILLAIRLLPLVKGDDTFQVIQIAASLFQFTILVSTWDASSSYIIFNVAVASGLAGIVTTMRQHIAFLVSHYLVMSVNTLVQYWLEYEGGKVSAAAASAMKGDGVVQAVTVVAGEVVVQSATFLTHFIGKIQSNEKHHEMFVYLVAFVASLAVVSKMHHETRVKYVLCLHVKNL